MAYLQHTSWRDRPGAVAGVVAIHALIGYALISGLTIGDFVHTPPRLKARDYVDVPLPPPPPPEPKPSVERDSALVEQPLVVPLPPLDLSKAEPRVDTTPIPLPTPDFVPRPLPSQTPAALPKVATFEPVGARPRGNPAGWVTVDDYRSSWINREMTGTARFRLEIGAGGRVEGCTITVSSGHPELDKATCALVTRRARFEPARDASGAAVRGSYSNAVRWELPE